MAGGVITVGQTDITPAMLPAVTLAPHEFLLPTEFSAPMIDPATGMLVEVDILEWEIRGDYASAIALELKSMAPRASWGKGPGAYAVAAMLAKQGARTMADVRVEPVDPSNADAGFRFDIRGRKVGQMTWEKDGRFTAAQTFKKDSRGYKVGVTARGDGRTHYYLGMTDKGLSIIPVWEDTSDLKTILAVVGVVVGVILPLASINFAGSLGSAIMGPNLSAAYPGLTQAIGNVAVSTALNGGDVEGAIRGAALGAVGAQAGGFVGSNVADLTGIDALGKVGAAATSALIRGGDPAQAAGWALAGAGLSQLPDFVSKAYTAFQPSLEPGSQPMSDLYSLAGPETSDWGFSLPTNFEFGSDYVFSNPLPDVAGAGFTIDPGQWAAFGNVGEDWFTPSFDLSATLFPSINDAPVAPSLTQGGTFDLTPIINQVSSAAMAALKTYQVYRQVTQSPPQQTARTVNADGSVRVVTDDGYIKTRTADGRITTAKPPVNQPVTSVGGFVIINNGDGTYTRINSAGQRETLPYSSANGVSGGVSNTNLAMLAAVGLGAFFLLKK